MRNYAKNGNMHKQKNVSNITMTMEYEMSQMTRKPKGKVTHPKVSTKQHIQFIQTEIKDHFGGFQMHCQQNIGRGR